MHRWVSGVLKTCFCSLGELSIYHCIMFWFPFISPGHKDSVTCALFSHDSTLVATGDMSGLIKVWKLETKEEIWSFEVGDLEVSEPGRWRADSGSRVT